MNTNHEYPIEGMRGLNARCHLARSFLQNLLGRTDQADAHATYAELTAEALGYREARQGVHECPCMFLGTQLERAWQVGQEEYASDAMRWNSVAVTPLYANADFLVRPALAAEIHNIATLGMYQYAFVGPTFLEQGEPAPLVPQWPEADDEDILL